MSKKQTTQSATFAIGDRVVAQTAATLHQQATGTITDISKTGWYIVKLDESNLTDVLANTKGKISARLSSIQHQTAPSKAPAGSIVGMLEAANAEAPAKAPKAATPKHEPRKIPDCCPECESGELESETDEDGNTTITCSCGWEETIEADKTAASRMAEALRQARQHYTKGKRPDGSATAHCGDEIAKELRDYDPQETANLADRVLQQPIGFHYAKYQNLNNGQIRMNSGNRIRAYWKKINEDGNEAEIDRVARLLNLENDE